jgi:hypothetical protein
MFCIVHGLAGVYAKYSNDACRPLWRGHAVDKIDISGCSAMSELPY